MHLLLLIHLRIQGVIFIFCWVDLWALAVFCAALIFQNFQDETLEAVECALELFQDLACEVAISGGVVLQVQGIQDDEVW